MFEMWNIWDEGCSGCGMFGKWNVWDVLNLNIISNHFNKFSTQIASEIDKKITKSDKKITRLLMRTK